MLMEPSPYGSIVSHQKLLWRLISSRFRQKKKPRPQSRPELLIVLEILEGLAHFTASHSSFFENRLSCRKARYWDPEWRTGHVVQTRAVEELH